MIIGLLVPDPLSDQKYDLNEDVVCDGEFGGFDNHNRLSRTELRIKHRGEVNRARYMPQNPAIVATKPPSSDVFIFNVLNDHSIEDLSPHIDCNPDAILTGHTNEGYGLDWNSLKENYVASGSDDRTLCIWDIKDKPSAQKHIDPLYVRKLHTGVVEDVRWHRHYEDLCLSVGDDRYVVGWDIRSPSESGAFMMKDAHRSEINSVDTSPFCEHLFVTGAADQLVNLWDLRYLNTQIHSFIGHYDEVFQTQFHPFDPSIVASGGNDGKVIIWDINATDVPNDATEPRSSSQAIFAHRGHTAKMSDFNFSVRYPWLVCSVAADNALHAWRPSSFAIKSSSF
ncbi:hypothetical protein ACOME3_009888 [Neoechinorhynchus agilis]